MTVRRKLGDLLTHDEIRAVSRRSNVMGAFAVATTWLVIAGVFVGLAYAATLPLALAIPAFVVGLVVLGGRHLALAILHHEAAHKSLFANGWLNDAVGDWLCARPVWNDLRKYRAHHLKHHSRTNQPDDPDLSADRSVSGLARLAPAQARARRGRYLGTQVPRRSRAHGRRRDPVDGHQ